MPKCNQRRLCDDDGCQVCFERSFASHPNAKYWCQQNEEKPRYVFKQSNMKYLFACSECNHTFQSALHNVVKGKWCPYCINKQLCNNVDCTTCFTKSFASHPKAECWSDVNNDNPRNVFLNTKNKYTFKCKDCNHTFESSLTSITNGTWCPYCAKLKLCDEDICQQCFENSFASHPRAKYWSRENEKKPRQVMRCSGTKWKFLCDTCHHVYDMQLNVVSRGSCCPYCCTPPKQLCDEEDCQHCFERSFASHPNSRYWSPENKKKPRQVFKGTPDAHKFICNVCTHVLNMNVSNVTKGQWCIYCAGKDICDNDSCEECYSKSFASHPKAKYWSTDNDKKPRQFMKCSAKKCKFLCDTCNHHFECSLNNIVKGNWCPYCVNKTERKLYDYLLSQNIQVTRQAKFDWCKNDETGKHLPFDFLVEDKRIIIEVDGIQHFEQVSIWQSPEKTQDRDILKQKLAQENGYTVIRIFQEDVLYDSYDWKPQLMQALVQYETPTCLYMSKDENRYCNYKTITTSS